MRIIYTCPQCGSDLQDIVITTNPPINQRVCIKCGWSYEEPIIDNDEVRVPFVELQHSNNLLNDPCIKCSNNPANGGSGICHCILGTQTIY